MTEYQYPLESLNGSTMWIGPAFQRGTIGFIMTTADGSLYCRRIELIALAAGKLVRIPAQRTIDLVQEGFDLFVAGQGLVGQLKRVLGRIGGFKCSLEPNGSALLEASFYDDPKRTSLQWCLEVRPDQLQSMLVSVAELEQSRTSPARCFADLYPVKISILV